MAKKQKDSIEFEASLQELESIVDRMEKGEMSLEQSLKDFERGVQLTRQCQQALKDAEQKVSILMKDDDNGLHTFELEQQPAPDEDA